MRPLVITQNMTVDGSVETLTDWFDPNEDDREMLAEIHRQSAASDTLLLGRKTFEDMRGYWPELEDDPTGIAEILDKQTKYVVSSTLAEPGWRNTVVLGSGWLEAVAELKESEGNEIGVTGSISLCHALIQQGLVDEYRLFVYPAVQGFGRRLFPEGRSIPRLNLVGSKTFQNGVCLLTYRTRSR
ncbi:dihydrofolate reductase [Prauserella marina]|uniref:Dihydrofolate reductase n=2 Tax=Prauserella marina TaxID=530584 RepID=A0A222VVT1_9PSEU|nr:dihydrofolate reductase [Prauserella marina]PWV73263.1 dihydrofolate reductase [Prauserella marina]SDD67869.1 Dihydrofolate reductase [Prauserella marina]